MTYQETANPADHLVSGEIAACLSSPDSVDNWPPRVWGTDMSPADSVSGALSDPLLDDFKLILL
jgi:hypothetical protein